MLGNTMTKIPHCRNSFKIQ